MKLHLCIVSDQLLPNLIPALMEAPDITVLLSSERMQEKAQQLAKLLRVQGVQVEIIGGMPDSGLESIYEFALGLQGTLSQRYPEAEIILNATGGTKLMVLGLVEFFRDGAERVIYTDTARRSIEVLPTGRQEPKVIPMENVLTVQSYLAAQGFQTKKIRSREPGWSSEVNLRKKLCKWLGENARELGGFIGALNGCAAKALNDRGTALENPQQQFVYPPRGKSAEVLEDLNQRDLLAWKVGTSEITFVDLETTRFLSGGWLEEYVYHLLKDNGAFDVCLGVEGQWLNGKGGKNEFDVLATQGNELLFVECKTLKHREDNDSEIAYKLESLGKDARGLFGRSWLVSARKPKANMADHAQRASFTVYGPDDLPNLRESVRQWIAG